MIRKFFLPALALALLGGCATGYQYRSGVGDYYYGQPSVQYDDYGFYGSGYSGFYGYGYPYDYFGSYGYGGFGYPYGWGPYPPYYPYHRPRHHHHDGDHDHDHDHDQDDPRNPGDHDHDDRGDRPPWRDLGQLKPHEPRPRVLPRRDPVMLPGSPPVQSGGANLPRGGMPVNDPTRREAVFVPPPRTVGSAEPDTRRRPAPVNDSGRRNADNVTERDSRRKRTP